MQVMYKYSLILILSLSGLSSCVWTNNATEEHFNLEYISVRRSGSLDTLTRRITAWNKSDTFNTISYKTKFNRDNDDIDDRTFKFPAKREFEVLSGYQLIDKRRFEFGDKEYWIFKYLADDKSADDEEMLYFYSPEFGVLIFRSAWWGNYEKLTVTGNKDKDVTIFYLTEMIANDNKDFFVKW